MFLAPYPAIRDPSVQGPSLSNKKIEGPLLAKTTNSPHFSSGIVERASARENHPTGDRRRGGEREKCLPAAFRSLYYL